MAARGAVGSRIPAGVEHVFGERGGIGQLAGALARVTDPQFLNEVGWDEPSLVLFLPDGHPLLGRAVCRAPGCRVSAFTRDRVCGGCRARLERAGLAVDQVDQLPVRALPDHEAGSCLVAGCQRVWASRGDRLCRAHQDQRRSLGVGVVAFLSQPLAVGLVATGPCSVPACPRQARHQGSRYCHAHQQRLRTAQIRDPGLIEVGWAARQPAIGVGGQVSLRGLPPLVVAQVLVGLQQRCRVDGVITKEGELRSVCDDLRRAQVASIHDYQVAPNRSLGFAGLVRALATHARRMLATPASEVLGDLWDLSVFGHSGTVSFAGLSQPWLRQAAKAWAADDLPRRRIRAGRRTSGGLAVRHHITALALLSESLRQRTDRGMHPAALGRADIDAFLNRLGFLAASRVISADARVRAAREVGHVLSRVRAMGLTRPGAMAGGLGPDFTIATADIPVKGDPPTTGRDIPASIMTQICSHLGLLRSASMRAGIELAIDTGRRPEEICDLAFDCLARDPDGGAVLVFDNHKAARLGRRLPIAAATAAVITAQQDRVRARYPDTAEADLKLLPTDRRNPAGTRSVTAFSMAFAHRAWVESMPTMHTPDGVVFDKALIVLYAYRHTYAQRHADAGVPIDVLRELMDHRKLDTTSGYYQVGATRRRDAVDRVAAMTFNRHGNRIWDNTSKLLDSEHARRAVGEVAVPFGVCAEPSNVAAGGGTCPYRFRCAGCDHFATDVSYLPDLRTHLDDLLRSRERILAATDLDQWAKDEAKPSQTEITRIRSLITAVSEGLDRLPPHERQEIEAAVTLLRAHRTVNLGMPRMRVPLPDIRPPRP